MDISVVVPVYNEAPNIAPLVGEVRAALEGVYDYELIYVDDASTDATWNALRELQRDVPRLRVLRHARRCGQSAAIMTGVRTARAPWIVTLDGDGQNDPQDIARLWSTLHDPNRAPRLGLVCGWRRERRDTRLKRLSSRIANGVRGRILRDRTPDTGCGLKLFARDLFLSFPAFDHMHRFLPALAQRAGAQVCSVPVRHRPRRHGASSYGVHNRLWIGIVDMVGVYWLQRRRIEPVLEREVDDDSTH